MSTGINLPPISEQAGVEQLCLWVVDAQSALKEATGQIQEAIAVQLQKQAWLKEKGLVQLDAENQETFETIRDTADRISRYLDYSLSAVALRISTMLADVARIELSAETTASRKQSSQEGSFWTDLPIESRVNIVTEMWREIIPNHMGVPLDRYQSDVSDYKEQMTDLLVAESMKIIDPLGGVSDNAMFQQLREAISELLDQLTDIDERMGDLVSEMVSDLQRKPMRAHKSLVARNPGRLYFPTKRETDRNPVLLFAVRSILVAIENKDYNLDGMEVAVRDKGLRGQKEPYSEDQKQQVSNLIANYRAALGYRLAQYSETYIQRIVSSYVDSDSGSLTENGRHLLTTVNRNRLDMTREALQQEVLPANVVEEMEHELKQLETTTYTSLSEQLSERVVWMRMQELATLCIAGDPEANTDTEAEVLGILVSEASILLKDNRMAYQEKVNAISDALQCAINSMGRQQQQLKTKLKEMRKALLDWSSPSRRTDNRLVVCVLLAVPQEQENNPIWEMVADRYEKLRKMLLTDEG